MKKRPNSPPLSEWKVLIFASKDEPLALLLNSIPVLKSRITIIYDVKKALEELRACLKTNVNNK